MASIPRDPTPDATLALLREGYEFVGNRRRRLGSDVFETRIGLMRVVCMTGRDAAEEFYGDGRFTRRRALPRTAITLLQDFGSVMALDGEAHDHRKQMFMDLMTRESIDRLTALADDEWRAAIGRWQGRGEVVLDAEAAELLCRAACAWTGVPLTADEARGRAADLAALFDGSGSFGPRQVRGQLARRRCEAWLEAVVDDVRAGRLDPGQRTPLAAVASHRGLDGQPLTTTVAAVELLNLLRPLVAVGRYVTMSAIALHEHPGWHERLRGADEGERERFVHEVRRLSPFIPLMAGRVATEHEWRGHRFRPGDWAMLDIYGTNRDERSWERPDEFDPERFRGWEGDPFALIPQGGGDYLGGRRCAGEWTTIALMKAAVGHLVGSIEYAVPDQDLRLPMWRMPTVPRSGFRLAPAPGG